MSRAHSIDMVIYTHPWSIHLLDEQILDTTSNNLLIEVATESNLSVLCGGNASDRSSKRAGALPLLTNPAKVTAEQLGSSIPLVPAPLVLAANPRLSRETLVQSLMALDTCDLQCDAVYLLVHLYNLPSFKPVFPLVDKFNILWDGADQPSEELTECTAALLETQSLTKERWGGFHLTNHWLRKTDNGDANLLAAGELMANHGL